MTDSKTLGPMDPSKTKRYVNGVPADELVTTMEEPVPHGPTEHDDYSPDTNADPEGAEARAENLSKAGYPAWIFRDFELSFKNPWGKPFADGKEHLVPTTLTLRETMAIHEKGISKYDQMIAWAMEREGAMILAVLAEYQGLLTAMPPKFTFSVMRNVQQIVQQQLALRAISKYKWLAATDAVPQDKELPDWIEKMQDRMWQTAVDAGMWYYIHQKLWEHVGYKNKPTYFLDFHIKDEWQKNAKWLDDQHRPVDARKALVREHKQVGLEF